jgi:ABC-type oligopeptide transport system substrate-binding subunit
MKLNQKLLMLAAGAAWLLASCQSKTTAEEKPPLIPVEEFFKNPEKFNWQISPDGEYIS